MIHSKKELNQVLIQVKFQVVSTLLEKINYKEVHLDQIKIKMQ
jgi:hypothetical protein